MAACAARVCDDTSDKGGSTRTRGTCRVEAGAAGTASGARELEEEDKPAPEGRGVDDHHGRSRSDTEILMKYLHGRPQS